MSPALHALLQNLVDYAGLFPPASLSLDGALANYRYYGASEHAWMLGRFVISAAQLTEVPADLDLRFAVLSDADDPRAAAIESKRILSISKPTYCEVPVDDLNAVAQANAFAKLRTGGVTADAIPSIETVAAYINTCAARRLAFKATAGLHHPIRSAHPLTYEPRSPIATMHGFINLFVAAAFTWHGQHEIAPILAETDPGAFRFGECAHWRDLSLSAGQIAEARASFAHSFGSCSFEEPIHDLQELKWL